MASARDENPYEGGGGFGKFRKRPFRRTQTTPFDRLLTALRNPSRNNGWFSKLVDPAQRLIASSANMLFASVFRKRLPPPPPPPRSSEAVQEARDNHQEAAVFVSIDDVASPVELAKAYMGSRPSKVSQSMLGLRNPPREDPTLLRNQHFAQKSPVMSIVPRATTLARVHENGFVTPRSHGRSAIYRMARTPYARVYPTSTLKGVGVAVEGEPSSSAQYALDHDMLSGSKQRALKRRSSVLDNDIRSFGPIRRIRHKCNLLSKGLTLPHSGAPLSIARNRVGIDAAQQPSSSMQKPILLGEVKHRHTKLSAENVDDTMPSTSFPPLSSKSSEMASKILDDAYPNGAVSYHPHKKRAFHMSAHEV
ncbi:nuclear pore complex protein NUP1-like isoform X1 [Gastrolobium bilobum]|uniref:nuclear pore complex protein NUP1-like isoform X1 n=1 Tax=Gastrolobium bilobum TaxID=150636 RepID=UPI002AAFCDBE|nr:nuclear pore complex protein NUP1-like isoform X1 [Gastrolobium bilobum]